VPPNRKSVAERKGGKEASIEVSLFTMTGGRGKGGGR